MRLYIILWAIFTLRQVRNFYIIIKNYWFSHLLIDYSGVQQGI